MLTGKSNKLKAQSAIEYLMTYGWAVLVVAVVVGALYALGVFSFGAHTPDFCLVSSSQFLCNSAVLASTGSLSATIGQVGQQPVKVNGVACTSNDTAPVTGQWDNENFTLSSGQPHTVSPSCVLASDNIGTHFQGYIWIDTESGPEEVGQLSITATTYSGSPVPAGGSPGIVYVPIIINNLQGQPTPANFQQQVQIIPSLYSKYENSNLGNIRFYQGKTELYSWCESGCYNTSSSAIFWVKIPQQIGAQSGAVVNMTFESPLINYDVIYAGEAPYLSSSYGEYDNGVYLFDYYDNFQSASGWTGYDNLGNSNVVFSNGMQITSRSPSETIGLITTASYPKGTYGEIFEGLIASTLYPNATLGISSSAGPASPSQTEFFTQGFGAKFDNGDGQLVYVSGNYNNPLQNYTAQFIGAGGGVIVGIACDTNSPFYTAQILIQDAPYYDDNVYVPNETCSASNHYYIGQQLKYPATNIWDWARARQNPPNGVMPTVTIGKLISGGATTTTTGSSTVSITSTSLSTTTSTSLPTTTSTMTYPGPLPSSAINMSVGQNITSGPWEIYLQSINQTKDSGELYIYYNGALVDESAVSAAEALGIYSTGALAYESRGPTYSYGIAQGILYMNITTVNSGASASQDWLQIAPWYYPFVNMSQGDTIGAGPWTVEFQALIGSGISTTALFEMFYGNLGIHDAYSAPRTYSPFEFNGSSVYLYLNSTLFGTNSNQEYATAQLWYNPAPATGSVVKTITGFAYPIGVAFNPTGTLAYVANFNSGTVSVINPTTNTIINTISVGGNPYDVAFNPAGNLAYVTLYNTGTVSVIKTATNTVINTITVGSEPYDVAFNPTGTLAYVANFNSGILGSPGSAPGPGTVSVINPSTSTVINTITLGSAPFGVAFNQAGTLAFVTNSNAGTVSVINPSTDTVIKTITVGSTPASVAFNPTGTLAYVANFNSGTISVINPSTSTVINTIQVMGGDPYSVAFNPAGTLAYVTNINTSSTDGGTGGAPGPGTVSVINPSTSTVISTITVGSEPYDVAFNPAGNLAYVTNYGSDTVSVINTTK